SAFGRKFSGQGELMTPNRPLRALLPCGCFPTENLRPNWSRRILRAEKTRRMAELAFKELEAVALRQDLPEFGLVAGDVGTVVFVHRDGQGYEVEFTDADGRTLAVQTLL